MTIATSPSTEQMLGYARVPTGHQSLDEVLARQAWAPERLVYLAPSQMRQRPRDDDLSI